MLEKIYVRIEDCIPGMRTAEKIFNKYWVVVVNDNVVLDEQTIEKLKLLNIEGIKVYKDKDNVIEANSSVFFKREYNRNIEVVKDVLHEISTGKNLDMQKVKDVSDTICDRKVENRNIIECLNQMRSIDEYTYSHSVNVSLLAMLMAKWLKYDDEKTSHVVQAGLLHDIGKGQISEKILNKEGPLTSDEFEEMVKHPLYGYRMAMEVEGIDRSVLLGILMHHEREDGTGYPMNAKGYQIHEFAKIIAVADIYDAMTSKRSYKDKNSPFEVFELMEDKAFGLLDPKIVNVFLNNISAYYIGDKVLLNSGDLAEVVYINPRHFSKPVVKIGEKFVDLLNDTQYKVLSLV